MEKRGCETCLAWVKRHQDSAYGFCYFGPQAIERHWNDWCLQWQERGDQDPRRVDDEAPWSDPGNVFTLETFQEALRLWPTRYGAWCHRCASWERTEGSSSVGVCRNPHSVINGSQTRYLHGCDSWSFRGPKQDPASLVCPDCHGPIEDIGQEGSLTVWQCRECERVTTAPLDADGDLRIEIQSDSTPGLALKSKPLDGECTKARRVDVAECACTHSADVVMCERCESHGGWRLAKRAEAPRPISSCVYAVQDDGIAKGYLFATREIAHEWLKREEKREHLEGCTIERYTLWHEVPPPECSWCDATGDLTSIIWKGEDLLLCKACLAKCTGKAASDE